MRAIQFIQNVRAFPLPIAISFAQHCLLQVERRRQRTAVGGEDEQEQRPIVVQRKAPEHPSRLSIHQIHVFVARTVTSDLERRDHVAEMLLEPILRPECKPANVRMQSIGADHQIEPALACMFELNLHTVCPLLKADDLIVENDFRRVFDLFEQQPRKVAAPERHITPACQLTEDFGSKASDTLAPIVYNSQLTHVIADAIDVALSAPCARRCRIQDPRSR